VANPAARKSLMFCMIAELIGNMNYLNTAAKGSHAEVCFYRNPLQDQEAINASGLPRREAYVCHESTTTTPSISNLVICCSQRTTLRFLYGVPSKRCGGSLKDQEETAKVGHPFGIGHLKRRFRPRQIRMEKRGETNVSSCLLRSRPPEVRLRPDVSTGNTKCSAKDILKACRMLFVNALPSNRSSVQQNARDQSRKGCAPSITTLVLFTRP
jgi:hypothetical protein